MKEFKTKAGDKVWIENGHITVRGPDGELLQSFAVPPTARMVDPRISDSSAQLQVEPSGPNDPTGGKWVSFEFNGHSTADEFLNEVRQSVRARIASEKKSGETKNDEPPADDEDVSEVQP